MKDLTGILAVLVTLLVMFVLSQVLGVHRVEPSPPPPSEANLKVLASVSGEIGKASILADQNGKPVRLEFDLVGAIYLSFTGFVTSDQSFTGTYTGKWGYDLSQITFEKGKEYTLYIWLSGFPGGQTCYRCEKTDQLVLQFKAP